MLEHLSGEDLTQAIRYSSVHDLAEIATTDVPHNVKRAFPSIAKAVDEAEEQLWQTEFLWAAKCKDKCNLRQKQWAKLADALSVLQYADSEIALGNTYMITVRSETVQFIETLIKALSMPKGFLDKFTA
jgi:5'-deoxynucleotidase YfbR-like HD superfamily hydrolase